MDGALFDELGLRGEGSVLVTSMAATNTQTQSVATDIAIGRLIVKGIHVLRMKTQEISKFSPTARGVLGEDFLGNFDLLIDINHRQITLDPGSTLSDRLEGKHVPLVTISTFEGEPVIGRPVISLVLPAYDRHALSMVLDSATEVVVVFPSATKKKDFGGDSPVKDGLRRYTGPCSAPPGAKE